jgi:hypothetical protein
MQDAYLTNDIYRALIEALPNVKPDPVTGKLEPHCFVEVLGEIGGIWPASVQEDTARGYTLSRVNLLTQ